MSNELDSKKVQAIRDFYKDKPQGMAVLQLDTRNGMHNNVLRRVLGLSPEQYQRHAEAAIAK